MPTRSLPLSSNPEWIALPLDPSQPLTPEQDAAHFSPAFPRLLRDLLIAASRDEAFMRRLAAPSAGHTQPVQPSGNSTRAREGVERGR